MRFISLALEGPDERYVWARSWRGPFVNLYVEKEYKGPMMISGYFTLIRPYPDEIDLAIMGLLAPRSLLAGGAQ